ncbi:NUDIX domain-containing protein [Streptomyces sp. AV19]|uniref:NUDIX domain-containing protein n=1 Tax=Streptomyces sp. AV19 TaxID=2793068 RepID=UPI0018FE7B44|nr:NUDIX domain-containing protein [Streptomyces sp. AV19]MBH1937401.1 NUDIX domain-containing protein [Streptomyces sp. AV19]MDG4533826.1 NUDIX domain-containing protein [Streptomyces sp. AV19]
MTNQQPLAGPRIRNSAVALVVRDGHVLLGHGDWPRPDTWWLPGGGQWPGETLTACVVREVLEETGVRVVAGPMLWVREYVPANHPGEPVTDADGHRVEVLFACTVVDEPETLGGIVPDEYQSDITWVPVDKVAGLRMIPAHLQDRLPDLIAQATAGQARARYEGDVA